MIIHTTPQKSPKKRKTAKQKQLAAEWQQILDKYKTKKKVKIPGFEPLKNTLTIPRSTRNFPSVDTGGIGSKVEDKIYTGDKMIGIATLHKSNSVPIFNNEAAIDAAKMRRG